MKDTQISSQPIKKSKFQYNRGGRTIMIVSAILALMCFVAAIVIGTVGTTPGTDTLKYESTKIASVGLGANNAAVLKFVPTSTKSYRFTISPSPIQGVNGELVVKLVDQSNSNRTVALREGSAWKMLFDASLTNYHEYELQMYYVGTGRGKYETSVTVGAATENRIVTPNYGSTKIKVGSVSLSDDPTTLSFKPPKNGIYTLMVTPAYTESNLKFYIKLYDANKNEIASSASSYQLTHQFVQNTAYYYTLSASVATDVTVLVSDN